jgi:hypothetical protein
MLRIGDVIVVIISLRREGRAIDREDIKDMIIDKAAAGGGMKKLI